MKQDTVTLDRERWTTVLQHPIKKVPRFNGMSLDTHLILENSSHLAADYPTTIVITKDFALVHNDKQCLVFHRIQKWMKDYNGKKKLELIFEHSS